jgi:hypothetical protein
MLPSLRSPLRRAQERKVDRLSIVGFGSARYALPSALVGHRVEVCAVEREIVIFQRDTEGAGTRWWRPRRCRSSTPTTRHQGGAPGALGASPERHREELSVSGEQAETFLRDMATGSTPRLAAEIADIVALEPSWGRDALIGALARATEFRRFRASDVPPSSPPEGHRGRPRRGRRSTSRCRRAYFARQRMRGKTSKGTQ